MAISDGGVNRRGGRERERACKQKRVNLRGVRPKGMEEVGGWSDGFR